MLLLVVQVHTKQMVKSFYKHAMSTISRDNNMKIIVPWVLSFCILGDGAPLLGV